MRWFTLVSASFVAAIVSSLALSAPAFAAAPAAPTNGMAPATSKVARYRLAARIRPLFFWFGKDNVGEARLTEAVDPNLQRRYSLLIGSDPARAPRRINRWGYVCESEDQGRYRVFGFMTATDEESFEQAKASTGTVSSGSQVFKVLQTTIDDRRSFSAVRGVALSDRLTLRDIDAVVPQLPAPGAGKAIDLPQGTEPGFLFAMASVLDETVDALERTGAVPGPVKRSFVYNNVLNSVSATSKLVPNLIIDGRTYSRLVESEFEVREVASGKTESYRVIYGTEGALRGVPVRAVYRPTWWFEAELVLSGEVQ